MEVKKKKINTLTHSINDKSICFFVIYFHSVQIVAGKGFDFKMCMKNAPTQINRKRENIHTNFCVSVISLKTIYKELNYR